jgi:tRNA-specific 2-thiouridylase
MKHIVVGLSGGVDSAVATLLLKQAGHRVTAVFMKNWDEDDAAGYCPAAADLEDARNICSILNVELKTVSFSSEYWDRVFTQFLDEYRAGRTPNPDIVCNREIKFRAFLDYALDMDADAIATCGPG